MGVVAGVKVHLKFYALQIKVLNLVQFTQFSRQTYVGLTHDGGYSK